MKLKTIMKSLSVASIALVAAATLGKVNVNAASTINVSNVGGYDEGLALIYQVSDNSETEVSYALDGTNTFTTIDSELIREDTNGYRADILGLSEGTYDVKITSTNGAEVVIEDIDVTSYDRSGYAHFNNQTGVGAYNNNGTLKTDTVVVYVSDATKNTVQATIAGTQYTGLSNIIKAQKDSSVPLDIRILDEIQTQQWTYIDDITEYGASKSTERKNAIEAMFQEAFESNESSWEDTSSRLDQSKSNYRIGEEDIINFGINSLSSTANRYTVDKEYETIENITYLEGLSSYVSRSKSKVSFDTYYNELDVRGASNITIEGVGDSAGIFQWGFSFIQCNSVEVRNLEFSGYPEDAIGIQGGSASDMDYHGYWIHHNTFNQGLNNFDLSDESDKGEGDGTSDFKFSYDLTISYCRYNNTHKSSLVGSSDTSYQYNVTFHHNYYYKCESRLPYTRNTNFHIYNCYYYASTGTNMQIYNTAYAFIESCYFENTKKTFTTSNDGVIKLWNNIVNSSSSTAASTSVVYASTRDEVVSNTCTDNSSGYTWSGTDYSSFDTDSNLFYYDQENNKTDVERMDEVEDLPTIIPTLAGFAIGQSNLSEYIEEGVPALYYSSQSGTYTDSDNEYVYYCVFNKITNLSLEDVFNMSIEYVVSVTLNDNTYSKTYNMNTVYTSLRMNGEVIPGAEEEDNTYYFYFLLNEITSSYNGASIVITANVYINDKLYTKTASEYVVDISDESDVEPSTLVFTNGEATQTGDIEFSAAGSIQSDKGSETINNVTYNYCLKLDSKGSVSFTIDSARTIKIYVKGKAAGTTLSVGNNTITTTTEVLEYSYDLSAGTYTISKISGESYIYMIIIE